MLYHYVLCGGDINTDSIDSSNVRKLYDAIECLNLKQVIDLQTRVINKTSTLLISADLSDYQSGVDEPSNSSYHFLVYCRFKCNLLTKIKVLILEAI